MFCPGKNFMYVCLGCTRAYLSRSDGDVICVRHDLKRCSVLRYTQGHSREAITVMKTYKNRIKSTIS